MAVCSEFEALLEERASGGLPPEEAQRVDAHLAGCAACRGYLRECEALFGVAALPPISPPEQAALTGLAATTRAALRRSEQRRTWFGRGSMAMLAAAAAILVVVAPGWNRHPVSHPAALPVPSEESDGAGESELASWALSDPFSEGGADEAGGSDETLSPASASDPAGGPDATDEDAADLYLNLGDGS